IEEECGSETPACAQAHIVSPEQSNVDGPAAAQTYGLPSFDLAAATAVAAPPLAGTLTVGAPAEGSVRVSFRDARSTGAACESTNACRSEVDSRSNIALLCAACMANWVRLADRSWVSFAAAAWAALVAAALALLASARTAARRVETTSMMLAWDTKSAGESLDSIAPNVPNGSE